MQDTGKEPASLYLQCTRVLCNSLRHFSSLHGFPCDVVESLWEHVNAHDPTMLGQTLEGALKRKRRRGGGGGASKARKEVKTGRKGKKKKEEEEEEEETVQFARVFNLFFDHEFFEEITELNLSSLDGLIPNKILFETLAKCKKSLKRLELVECDSMIGNEGNSKKKENPVLRRICAMCSELEHLSVTHCHTLRPSAVEGALLKLKKLCSIDMSFCVELDWNNVMLVCDKFPGIKHLKAEGIDLPKKCVVALGNCKLLETLWITSTNHGMINLLLKAKFLGSLRSFSLQMFTMSNVATLLQCIGAAPFLTDLSLDSCVIPSNRSDMNEGIYRAIPELLGSRALRLRFSDHTSVPRVTLSSIALNCRNLVELDFRFRAVDDDILCPVVGCLPFEAEIVETGCMCLERVYLCSTNITELSVRRMANRLTKLQKLDISKCSRVHDFDLTFLQGVGNTNSHFFPSLEYISLAYTNITYDVAFYLLKSPPRLSGVDLTGCRSISRSDRIELFVKARNSGKAAL
eukprot:Nk52_evm5s166 gene=Nk52_evmTU5s166